MKRLHVANLVISIICTKKKGDYFNANVNVNDNKLRTKAEDKNKNENKGYWLLVIGY